LVATDPVFSRQHESPNVIPLLDADKIESPFPDFVVGDQDWLESLGGIKRALAFSRLDTYSHVVPGMQERATERLEAMFTTPTSTAERRGNSGPAVSSDLDIPTVRLCCSASMSHVLGQGT
jgi:hypothetical protein